MTFDASRCLFRVFITQSQYGSRHITAIGMLFVTIVGIACPACDKHTGDGAEPSPVGPVPVEPSNGEAPISLADIPMDLGPEFQSLELMGPIEYTDMNGENTEHTGALISIGISEEQLHKLGRDIEATLNDIGTDHDEISFSGKTTTGLNIMGGWCRSNQRLEFYVVSDSMFRIQTIGGEVSSTKELPIDLGPEFHAIEAAEPIQYRANKKINGELDGLHVEMTVQEEPIRAAMQALGAETREAQEKLWGPVVYFRTWTSTGVRIDGGWRKQGDLFVLWLDQRPDMTFEEQYGRPPYYGYPPEWDEDGWSEKEDGSPR